MNDTNDTIDTDRRWVGSMPEAYDRGLAPAVFEPFVVDLAGRVARSSPSRVLEVAAGTGVLTRQLAMAVPSAALTATDLNGAMVRFGARRVPAASWRQADAVSLPFDDGQFDLVVCQFGVMFFPDKPAAFAEMRRVLAPGGRLRVSAWSTTDRHGFAAALEAGIERAFPDDPPTFVVEVPHGYSHLGRMADDLAAGGLACVATEEVTLEGASGSAADVATGFCTGTPLRMAIEERGDLVAVTEVIGDEMRVRLGEGPVRASMTANLAEARVR